MYFMGGGVWEQQNMWEQLDEDLKKRGGGGVGRGRESKVSA